MFINFIILLNLISFVKNYFILANETYTFHPIEIKPDIHPQQLFSTINKIAICKQPLNYGNCSRKLPRFYWDVKSGQCLKFFYTGCGGNRNRFLNKRKCRKRCSPKHKHRKTKIIAKLSIQNRKNTNNNYEVFECKPGYAGSGLNCTKDQKICAQPFDRRYERQCLANGNENNLQARWYFNINSGRCRLFWYGGCQLADAQNFFLDQQLEGQKQFLDGREEGMNNWNDNYLQTNRISTQSSQKHCLEPFDHSLRRPCAIGIWKQRYFFDSNILRCRSFWMDASCFREEIMNGDENSYSKDLNNYFKRPRNLFNNLIECQKTCEKRTNKYPQHPHRIKQNLNQPDYVDKKKKAKQAKLKWIKEDKCLKENNDHKIREHLQVKNKLKIKEKINEEKINNSLKMKACFEVFDLNLTKNCGKFPWKISFFFDQNYNVCRPFWYNGCNLNSKNYFENEKSCKEICEKERENLTINKDKYGYFGIGEETTTKILNKTSKYFPILTKTEKYIRSKPLIMDENECTQFYYHAKTKEKVGGLKVFLCLLEEGGQCQMNILPLIFNNEKLKCFTGRPWLKGKHSYVWFFGLDQKLTKNKTKMDISLILKLNKNNSKNILTTTTNNYIFIELLNISNKCSNIC
uniref:BPTI/Kunitz inhibitor domain-containing protein n=1 Tax=Meloidogyne enterolobii TaxID=390850 RepID=A0A6V7WIX5_MELEN|nr:unnamed protein product [Meloidogyne enterolobii]